MLALLLAHAGLRVLGVAACAEFLIGEPLAVRSRATTLSTVEAPIAPGAIVALVTVESPACALAVSAPVVAPAAPTAAIIVIEATPAASGALVPIAAALVAASALAFAAALS